MKAPDLARIAELSKRLDDLCTEGQEIRSKIAQIVDGSPVWPDRRRVSRGAGDAAVAHDRGAPLPTDRRK